MFDLTRSVHFSSTTSEYQSSLLAWVNVKCNKFTAGLVRESMVEL